MNALRNRVVVIALAATAFVACLCGLLSGALIVSPSAGQRSTQTAVAVAALRKELVTVEVQVTRLVTQQVEVTRVAEVVVTATPTDTPPFTPTPSHTPTMTLTPTASAVPSKTLLPTRIPTRTLIPTKSPVPTTEPRYIPLVGHVMRGVKVYYLTAGDYGFTILGGSDRCPSMPSGKGLYVRYPDGLEGWKDRDASVFNDYYFVRENDPALRKFQWVEYTGC